MKSAPNALLAAVTTLALTLSPAPAALAHGGVPDGHGPDGTLGAFLLPPEFVLGGVAFFGALYFLKRRRG